MRGEDIRYEGLLAQGSVWVVAAAPTVWALHFLFAYWTGAVWCAKVAAADASVLPVRLIVGALTLVALALIGWLAWHARRRYRGRLRINDDLVADSEAERTRFMGHAALLLCTLSALGVIFDSLPAVVLGCR